MRRSGGRGSRRGAVRIIGGSWRRRRIAIPGSVNLRPTPDRVRETLFNWLAPVLPGAVCLDLFAGTGVLGLESLSRGAARAVLVEHDPQVAGALRRITGELAAPAEIICEDALAYLARARESFDVVFVDPPYTASVEAVLDALRPRLKSLARIYLERALGETWPDRPWLDFSHKGSAGAVAFGLAELVQE